MPIQSVNDLVQALTRHPLLEPLQFDELTKNLRVRFPEPRSLSKELMQRGWLTPYQVNQLFQDQGQQLTLGSYVLLERVSEGVMGDVFKARHQHMRRTVALQVIRPELLRTPGAVERFYEEVQAASQLSHPNIVASYDAGPIGNTHFFAMEFLEGIDLDRLVQQSGSLGVKQACDLMRQAALGLQHAYQRGLRHHDLKPGNLLITEVKGSGIGKLGDSKAPGGESMLKIRNLGLTIIRQPTKHTKLDTKGARPSTAFSTADYIAPERVATGELGDIRAELYSLGCTFYFLLSGQVPFPGGTVQDKHRCHQEADPASLESLCPEAPPEVSAIIRKLMAKAPEDRYQQPAEVAAALAGLQLPAELVSRAEQIDRRRLQRREVERQRMRRWVVIGGAALAVGLLFFVTLLVLQLQPSKPTVVAKASPTEPEKPVLAKRPALLVDCGKAEEICVPTYGWKLIHGSPFNHWKAPPAGRTHGWCDGNQIRFELQVPPSSGGVLKLLFVDGDSNGRKQKVTIAGRPPEIIENFAGAGRQMVVPFELGQLRDGKIEVTVQNVAPSPNCVISAVEFVPHVLPGAADPTLPIYSIQCGKGNGINQEERVTVPGYGCKLTQGRSWDGWPATMPRTHCWVHEKEIRFEVTVPPGASIGLQLLLLDDGGARKEKLFIQDKELASIENFNGSGRRVNVFLSGAETAKGKLEVKLQSFNNDTSAVLSAIEIYPTQR
ncbi:MAG: serine/threonine protein kinase [Gemmataceae bacterium]|nr:serine/threonine protein kinase [Gemmataceae bacterium]